MSQSMVGKLEGLTGESKEKVLLQSIVLASIDNKIDSVEYVAICEQARKCNLPRSHVDALIIEECVLKSKLKPPPQRKDVVDKRRAEFDDSRTK